MPRNALSNPGLCGPWLRAPPLPMCPAILVQSLFHVPWPPTPGPSAGVLYRRGKGKRRGRGGGERALPGACRALVVVPRDAAWHCLQVIRCKSAQRKPLLTSSHQLPEGLEAINSWALISVALAASSALATQGLLQEVQGLLQVGWLISRGHRRARKFLEEEVRQELDGLQAEQRVCLLWTNTQSQEGKAEPAQVRDHIFLIPEVKETFLTIHTQKGSSKVKKEVASSHSKCCQPTQRPLL